MEHLDRYLHKLNIAWSSFYYLKPVLELLCIIVLYYIIKAKVSSRLKAMCIIYLSSVFILFFTIDALYVIASPLPNSARAKVQGISELLNILFGFIELYIFFEILNYNLKSTRLNQLKWLFILLMAGFTYPFIELIFHSASYKNKIYNGELCSAVFYAFLTIGLIAYHFESYKREICWTYSTPLAFAIFCYVTMSLLLFPCSAFFYRTHSLVYNILNCYHTVLLSIVCIFMGYVICRKVEGENETLMFNN
jgi:hypothetical protein